MADLYAIQAYCLHFDWLIYACAIPGINDKATSEAPLLILLAIGEFHQCQV